MNETLFPMPPAEEPGNALPAPGIPRLEKANRQQVVMRLALEIPYNHHEKWDGSGYPNGLKGEQIPLAARIFTVVDVFDALTSDRPYRLAWPREKALNYIREQAGKYFDPAVVEMFLKIVDSIKQL